MDDPNSTTMNSDEFDDPASDVNGVVHARLDALAHWLLPYREMMRVIAPHPDPLSHYPRRIADTLDFLEVVSLGIHGSVNRTDLVERLMKELYGTNDDPIQHFEPRREFRFGYDDLSVLRWIVVKLLYPIGRSESDERDKIPVERIADELNISERTVQRIVKDQRRNFASVVSERPDLAKLAYEIHQSIVKPRLAVDRAEFGVNDWQSLSIVEPVKLTRGERPNFPKSPERRRVHAVRLLRSAIASAFDPSMRPAELTLEMARHVLGAEAPNAKTLEELLEALANRDSGRIRESVEKPQPIGFIGFWLIQQATLAEIDARLEAWEMSLGENAPEQYVRIHTDPKSLTREEVREIARKTDADLAHLACEFGPNSKVARLLGIDKEEISFHIDLWNRHNYHNRRGSVIADLFNVSRRLRLHLRIVEKENQSRSAKRRAARAQRRGARLREET